MLLLPNAHVLATWRMAVDDTGFLICKAQEYGHPVLTPFYTGNTSPHAAAFPTCSWSALLLQISQTSTLHWLQSAQVSWLGLCGPETSPWSAGTSLLASIECHADDRQRLFNPFSLVGCQG